MILQWRNFMRLLGNQLIFQEHCDPVTRFELRVYSLYSYGNSSQEAKCLKTKSRHP